jgi:tRNA modification GTPase
MERARQSILALIDTWPLGNHLVNPWKVVLAGPPNVGKSSLINALVGFQRSIVFDQPGTTRDVVSVQTAMDGWPIELSDTAGIRSATDAIEAEGVERAQAQLASADLVILVTDPDQAADRLEDLLLPDVTKVIRVWNKSDLHAAPSGEFLATSTLEQTGVAELLEAIVGRLVSKVPAAGDAVVFTQRQYDILLTTLSRLDDLSTSQDATPCIEKLAELTSLAR